VFVCRRTKSSSRDNRIDYYPGGDPIFRGAVMSASEFTINTPNDLPRIRQLSAPQLRSMFDEGLPLVLVDVRTAEERAFAEIEGSRLLDQQLHDYLLDLDRNTPIVFQCHHGIRSQSAAEYYLREQGFRNLYNLQGGIDAWSQLVDPSVPRY
jgi:monothiol glutaredoxin